MLGMSDETKNEAVIISSFTRVNTSTMVTEKDRLDGYAMALRGGNVLILNTTQIAKDKAINVAWVEQGTSVVDMNSIHCTQIRGAVMVRAQGVGVDLVHAQRDAIDTLIREHGVVSWSRDRAGVGANGHEMITRNTSTRMWVSHYVMKDVVNENGSHTITFVGYADVR
jgi:hypothetical protein